MHIDTKTREIMDVANTKGNLQAEERGMTLLEVMISTIILGIVLVGLGQAMAYGIKINNESKMRVANLNMCKYVTENLKTQLSQSQAVFDGTDASDTTYYVDASGNKTTTASGGNTVAAFTNSSAFRVRVIVAKGAYTKDISGVEVNLVRILEVRIVDVQNREKTGREVTMKVEMIRPSTSET
jgi:prepilin-type N-terminal cleavage/methylation domain-containing protein